MAENKMLSWEVSLCAVELLKVLDTKLAIIGRLDQWKCRYIV